MEDELDIMQVLREVWNSVKNTLIEMSKTWNPLSDDCDLSITLGMKDLF